ncbi:MAG: ATP-binding cassette domain-containing protein, partial [Afipia sp.]|nr:ATP-binding cassette domain-containing protein [Afipia sp.]
MSTHLIARDLGLTVPHFLQGEKLKQGLYSTLATAAFTRSRREMRTLLRGISFEVREGNRVAIMGRNGAGKTTLLRLLTG